MWHPFSQETKAIPARPSEVEQREMHDKALLGGALAYAHGPPLFVTADAVKALRSLSRCGYGPTPFTYGSDEETMNETSRHPCDYARDAQMLPLASAAVGPTVVAGHR